MLRKWLPIPAAFLAGLTTAALLSGSRAQAFETFVLEKNDQLIAEAPGCYAECQPMGDRRTCSMRDPNCRAVCQTIPECRPDGIHPVRACAVVRSCP